jgi:hypothetical protein
MNYRPNLKEFIMYFKNLGVQVQCPGFVNPVDLNDVFMDGDDFQKCPVTAEDYTLTQATQGTMALSAGADNGVLLLDCNSSTTTQGANMQRIAAQFTPKADRDIWFEARVKVADTGALATAGEIFVGLSEIDTTIIATSVVSPSNFIGFSSVTDDGVLLSNSEKADAGTTSTGATIAEDTWITLGFHVTGVSTIDFFVNGVNVATHTTANIPIVALAPSFVMQSSGTTDPIMHIDYWTCIQTR